MILKKIYLFFLLRIQNCHKLFDNVRQIRNKKRNEQKKEIRKNNMKNNIIVKNAHQKFNIILYPFFF